MGASQSQPQATLHYDDYVRDLPLLEGKTIAVTGCTSGTGLVLAKTCAAKGAHVILLNRPSERADKALVLVNEARQNGAPEPTFVPCDLQSFASVKSAGATLRARFREEGVDVLCNNAGIMAVPDAATGDGYDVQMQSNHLSHFLLTSEMWPLLERAAAQRGEARVVNHSSGARKTPPAGMDAEYLRKNGGNLGGDGFPGLSKWKRYQQTKLANLLFTYALHDKIAFERPGSKVKVLCAHPGTADTGLQGKALNHGQESTLDKVITFFVLKLAQSTEDGTCGIARASFDPSAQSAEFYGPQHVAGAAILLAPERSPSGEKLLWNESMRAVGLTNFFRDE